MTGTHQIDDRPAIRGSGETADEYPGVVVQINNRWRVITCSGGPASKVPRLRGSFPLLIHINDEFALP
jgi:hypothetical protein